MRIRAIVLVEIALLAALISCGGDTEPETVDSLSIEVTADTLITEEAVITEESDQLEITEEAVNDTANPEGLWDTTMGQLELVVVDSGNVTGEYPLGSIEGTLSCNVLEFTYSEGALSGEGVFTYEEDFNSFTGFQDISGTEFVWDGRRLQAQ